MIGPPRIQPPISRRLFWMTLGFVAVAHVWIISAGTITYWPDPDHNSSFGYFDSLAGGFLHGHTYLAARPDPRLLALPDWYDPFATEPYWIPDVSLYNGKYYLYWGPVPALLLVPLKIVLGAYSIHDKFLVFFFTLGVVVLYASLIRAIRRRFFPTTPAWVEVVGVLVLGLCSPITYLLTHAAVYEASIMGGQFFLAAGICLAFAAFSSKRLSLFCLAAVGASLAAAVGCRVSTLLGCLAVCGLCSLYLIRNRSAGAGWRVVGVPLVGLWAPMVAGGALLATYNHARFGFWTEIGVRYQLNRMNLYKYSYLFTSLHNIPINLVNYFLLPPKFSTVFPFVLPVQGLYPSLDILQTPRVETESITGLLITVPFVFLTWFPVRAAYRGSVRSMRGRPQQAGSEGDPLFRWAVWSLALAAILVTIPVLCIFSCTMRYLGDIVPTVMVLAVMGMMSLTLRRPGGGIPAFPRLACGALVVVTLIFGLFLPFGSASNLFRTKNPALYYQLAELTYRGEPHIDLVGYSDHAVHRSRPKMQWLDDQDLRIWMLCGREGAVRLEGQWFEPPDPPGPQKIDIRVSVNGAPVAPISVRPGHFTLDVNLPRGGSVISLQPEQCPFAFTDSNGKILTVAGAIRDLKAQTP